MLEFICSKKLKTQNLNFLPRSAGHLKTEIYALDDIQEIYSEIT
jgi:hypothetical protein